MAEDNVSAIAAAAKEIVKPVYDDALAPAAKQIGKTLELVGMAINVAFLPLRAIVWKFERIEAMLEKELAPKLAHLEPDKILPPPPHIAVPAIEALRYTAEQEELRELFVNLIATSMDPSSVERVHPAYVEVIKQLSVADARALRYLNVEDDTLMFAELEMRRTRDESLLGKFVFEFLDDTPLSQMRLVLSSLERQGILSPSRDVPCQGDYGENGSIGLYAGDGRGSWSSPAPWLETLEHIVKENAMFTPPLFISGVAKMATLTPFGREFLEVVVSESDTTADRMERGSTVRISQ